MTYSNAAVADSTDAIKRWIASLAKSVGVSVKWRRRGNSLYLLWEAPSCPEQAAIVAQVKALLAQENINDRLSFDEPFIHQLWCYGRSQGAYEPAWSTA
ncbi:MAG: hypothetical protein AAF289_13140, partial [Cyanobacteria bacterium P01_A01_bin.135]